jgi:hypothetical protein
MMTAPQARTDANADAEGVAEPRYRLRASAEVEPGDSQVTPSIARMPILGGADVTLPVRPVNLARHRFLHRELSERFYPS